MYSLAMVSRPKYMARVDSALRRSPITALLGPRQCGKTTLALAVSTSRKATYFDLESQADLARLSNPELALSRATGLVIIDEIQRAPELFATLRVLVDREPETKRFLVLGSASPEIVRNVSESLAGRVEFVDLAGFDLEELGPGTLHSLWLRGGFPRSFLADSDEDSSAWRQGFIRTFLEQDIPQLGISLPAPTMRRFWTMLAHYHGQTWNAAELSRSMGLSDKTIRGYLDILTGTYMVRQLQPWHENVSKRQVKSPRIYFQDTGLLHTLLAIPDLNTLTAYPRMGASWEGFVIEQVMRIVSPPEAYFWATHQGAELDLLFAARGHRFGIEVKHSEAPRLTKSETSALETLKLHHLWVIYPGNRTFPMRQRVTAIPVGAIVDLPELIRAAT